MRWEVQVDLLIRVTSLCTGRSLNSHIPHCSYRHIAFSGHRLTHSFVTLQSSAYSLSSFDGMPLFRLAFTEFAKQLVLLPLDFVCISSSFCYHYSIRIRWESSSPCDAVHTRVGSAGSRNDEGIDVGIMLAITTVVQRQLACRTVTTVRELIEEELEKIRKIGKQGMISTSWEGGPDVCE